MVRINDTREFTINKENLTASQHISNEAPNNNMVRRPRSLTTLKLEVVAERARKMKKIKESLACDSYKVNSNEVAKKLLEQYNEDDLK